MPKFPILIIPKLNSKFIDFKYAHKSNILYQNLDIKFSPHHPIWKKPSLGLVKINFDIKITNSKLTIIVIIRYSIEKIQGCWSRNHVCTSAKEYLEEDNKNVIKVLMLDDFVGS